MNIIPGTGIGSVNFGISEFDLIAALGKSFSIEESEYTQGGGDWYRTLLFEHLSLSFTFDKEDCDRLTTITVFGPNHLLFGKDLFDLSLSDINRFIAIKTKEIAINEDYSCRENESFECLDHESLAIIFWFKNKRLTKMDCTYFFEPDNETVIWPLSGEQK